MIDYLNAVAIALVFFIIFNLLGKGYLDFKNIWEQAEPLKNVLEFIANVPKWLDYYNHLNANQEILREKMVTLQKRKEDLEAHVESEVNRTGKSRKREVDHWLTSVVTKESEVQSILNKMERETNHFNRFVYKAWLGNQVERLIQQIDYLFSLGQFEQVLSPVRENTEFPTRRLVGSAAENNIQMILGWLNSSVMTLIGVHGIEGVGKTEIFKHTYNQLTRNRRDLKVYMILVPENFTDYVLQTCIANEMGYDLQEEDEQRRAACLHTALRRKNFVLFLDGLGRTFSVENVGIPLAADKWKMVISSRSPDVCRMMGCRPYDLTIEGLDFDDGLELFKTKLELESPLTNELEQIAQDIVLRCQGVPKRIINNAKLLIRQDNVNVWSSTLVEIPLHEA